MVNNSLNRSHHRETPDHTWRCCRALWPGGESSPHPWKMTMVQKYCWVLAMPILAGAKISPVLSRTRTLVLYFSVLYGQNQFLVFLHFKINWFLDWLLFWNKLVQSFSKSDRHWWQCYCLIFCCASIAIGSPVNIASLQWMY